MFFKKKKQEEKEKDEYHIKFGFFSNTVYILSMMHKYKKGLVFTMILFSICVAANNYIFSFIGKIGIDLVQSQALAGITDPIPYVKMISIAIAILIAGSVINVICNNRLWYNYIYVRMKLCQVRIEKALTMNYEALESPKMLDRMYKASNATGSNNNGVEGMMHNLQSILTSILSFIMASAIISTLNAFLVVVIAAISIFQFYFFKKTTLKVKELTWDQMAPIERRINYMSQVGSDFSYAKDIRLYSMKDWLCGKLSVAYDEKQEKMVHSKDNIALSHEASEQELLDICKLVGIDDKISSLEKGLDTVIFKSFDKDGIELSGGEQQKLAIARALYKNSLIVILDEPTAALDPIAEYDIYRQFDKLVGGKTAIYISHRLSSCRFCDKIAVFSDGTIKEYGHHDELVKYKNGIYAEMFQAKAQYYQ
jgi:ABC-type oligopeptide transport system ATPase subunit